MGCGVSGGEAGDAGNPFPKRAAGFAIDWFIKHPNGGGTVYTRPVDWFTRMPTGGTVYERNDDE